LVPVAGCDNKREGTVSKATAVKNAIHENMHVMNDFTGNDILTP